MIILPPLTLEVIPLCISTNYGFVSYACSANYICLYIFYRSDKIFVILNHIQDIFCVAIHRCTEPSPMLTKYLQNLITLLFHAASKYVASRSAEHSEKRIDSLFSVVDSFLRKDWIIRHYSVYFGDPTALSSRDRFKASAVKELKVMLKVDRFTKKCALCITPQVAPCNVHSCYCFIYSCAQL